jgi:uncharacterized membrane protein YgcG
VAKKCQDQTAAASIELGRDWGGKWDTQCQRILDQHVLPKFKGERYSAGITVGVRELAAMAQLGPENSPPGSGFVWRLVGGDNGSSPIPVPYRIGILILGVLLCLYNLLSSRGKFSKLGMGSLAIFFVFQFTAACALLVMVLFIIAVLNNDGDGSGGRSYRGSRSSGGFSSGGGGFSSRGGGASGSWQNGANGKNVIDVELLRV